MKPMDFEQARHNMIEQQVRPWDVLDQRVLDVMTTLPREAFVPEQYRALAFADISIPLGQDQVMMSPKLEGRLLQTLDIKQDDTVLEIGTGSGYLTACLASLGQHVTSWEIFPELSAAAKARLAEQDIGNVTLEVGDATREIADEARYDVIAVTGSVPVLQQQFHANLKPGGRLFVITGKPPIMEALLITRLDADNWARESLFETSLPPLVNATEPLRFAL